MATRLKRLDLHGFKSFSTPTSFVFDTGFTAIIGPNGSGKSNISDALRWVLGEQSYANLRGRRTEDIIFAGSASRAPVGMAEVTVTLDNQDGSLPIAFSEVSVTRRAYRSGENQYLINGARVRLRDVLQVTASLGQSHTVIGQGLVDAVLSQRADERRGLFEHAAGITGLRIKYAAAARNLEESQTNSTRLEDLLADLEPRLRSLERAAKQAREYDDVRRQLRSSLERYYARHWRQAIDRLDVARRAADSIASELASAQEVRDTRRQQLAKASRAVVERSAGIDALRAEIQQTRDEQQRLTHDLALIDERQSAACSRRADAERALGALESSIEQISSETADLAAQLDNLRQETAAREEQVQGLETAQAASRSSIAQIEARLTAADQRRAGSEREALLADNRIGLLTSQLEQLDAERERLRSNGGERESQRSLLESRLAQLAENVDSLEEQLTDLADQEASLSGDLAERVTERDRLHKRLAAIERRAVEAGTRYETLKRLEESGVGLYAGVRSVLDIARKGQLSGVLGTLASLLIVPAELEAAVEAALGGHLQDLVVEHWADAEAAIEHLKRSQSGRATFHPLDTVQRRGQSAAPDPTPGIRGLAPDLIGMDERVRPVVDGLLGRVLVADDLLAARAVLRQLPSGWSVVTLGGEIARASGTVTGGSRIKESGALARERELRDLPRLQATLRNDRQRVEAEIAAVEATLQGINQRRSSVDQAISSARSEQRGLSSEHEAVSRRLVELERDAESDASRIERLDTQRGSMQQEIDRLTAGRADTERCIARAQQEAVRLRDELQQVRQAVDDEPLLVARSELSSIRERIRGFEEQRRRLESRLDDLGQQRSNGQTLLAELDAVMSELLVSRQATANARDEQLERLSVLEARYKSALTDQQTALRAEQDAREGLDQADEHCRDLERRQDHLALDEARRRDELDLTVERAGRDLEEDDVEFILSRVEPAGDEDLPRLEREIARLRERLRRIGVAGDDAVEQYEREAERYSFLRRQLDDVRAATDALRSLMTELDRTMASEFDRTFSDVARAFESTFTALFGGGKARLIRGGDEEGATAIEIVAQPPGKRLQTLGLLSGGERALTAVALLFSILKVNPSPFCLLDEVDAALDEANVVRVRDELRRLSEKTQFVVVTHNRATIEGADTLYGITMGDDGMSRVLSLRMPVEAVS